MTGRLWHCRTCDRLVNRFVNGATCPDCGGSPSDGMLSTERGP
ncbi:hypothetical protein [Halorubrum lipolyticum]|nr:hypothetical protein [Halorubrum lipolyticum]